MASSRDRAEETITARRGKHREYYLRTSTHGHEERVCEMLVLTYVVGEPSKLDSASDDKSSISKGQVIAEVPVTDTVPDTGSNTFAPCACSCER